MKELFDSQEEGIAVDFPAPEKKQLPEDSSKVFSAHAALAAGIRGQNPAMVYESSRTSMLQGDTSVLQQEADAAYEPTVQERQQLSLDILATPGLTKDVYDNAIKEYQLASGKGAVKDLPSINAANFALQEPPELSTQNSVLDERAAIYSERAESRDSIERMLNSFVADINYESVRAVKEFYEGALLPENTAYANEVKSYLEEKGWGVESDWKDIFSPGGAVQDIIKYGNSLPLEAKKQFFKDFLDGVSNANGVVGDPNQYASFAIATAVGEHMAAGTEYKWWEKLLDNLEVAGLLPLVSTLSKGTVKIGKQIFGSAGVVTSTSLHEASAAAVLAKSAPNTSGPVLANAAMDARTADMAGTNPQDILLGLGVPKYQAADLSSAPANIVDEINKIQIYGTELINKTLYNGFLLTKGDEDTAIKQALKEAEVLANKQPAMHVHNQQLLYRDENGFVWQNMFGNGNVGYAKKSEALETARLSTGFDVESDSFEIVKFNPKDDTYSVVYNGAKDYGKPFKDQIGEYYIRTTQASRYDPSFLTPLVPTEFPKQGRLYGMVAEATKTYQYLKSVEAILPREAAKQVTSTFTSRVALKDNLDRLTATYDKLNDLGKARVMKAVEDGANYTDPAGNVVGKKFSYSELAGMGLKDNEIISYFQVTEVNRVAHAIRNRKVYEQLQRDGWQRIADESVDFDTIGKNVISVDDAKAKGLKEVYDPYTNGRRKLSPEILDFLYSQGGRLVELKQPMRVGNKKFKHAFVKDVPNTTRQLPTQVLNSVDGYAGPRIYDESYFITAKNNNLLVDGLPADEAEKINVIHAARTQQEVNSLLQKLRAQNPDVEYDFKMGRELVGKVDDFTLENASGGLYYSKRGQPLVGDNDRLARIVDPIRAMDVQKNNISKVAVTEDMVSQLERQWLSTFGEKYSSKKGLFPLERSELVNPRGLSDAEFRSAQAMWDLIDSYRRVGEPDKIYRTFMLGIAQTLDNARFGNAGARGADWFYSSAKSGVSPMSRLKSAAFTLSIALRPIRQLYLQAAQHGYLGALDLDSLGTSYRQLSGVSYAKSAELMGRGDGMVVGAKMAGMNQRDFTVLFEAFKESGLSRQVDTHQATSQVLRDPQASLWDGANAKYFTDKAIDTLIRKPIHLGRTIGFDTGERYNQLMTFLFSYNRLSKKAGKALDLTDRKTLDNVVGETNLLTFNMTGAGEFGIQNGWLRNTAQFMTFQIKSMQNLLGATKTFTPKERARIAGVTLALWGAGGFGLRDAWTKMKLDSGAEIDPVVDEAISGGFAEMALNKAATELFQEDDEMKARIDFAGNTSPFSGVMFWEMINWDKPVYEAALGASAYTGRKVYDAMEYGGNLFFHNPSLRTTEKLGLLTKRMAEVIPTVSDYTKYHVAKETGWLRDSNNDPKIRVTAAEAYSLLLGMYPERASEQTIIGRKISEKVKDLEADAKAYVDMMLKYKDVVPEDLAAAKEQIEVMAGVLSTLPEEDQQIVRANMLDYIEKKHYKDSANLTYLWQKLLNRTGGAEEEVRSYLDKSDLPEAMQSKSEELYDSLKSEQ